MFLLQREVILRDLQLTISAIDMEDKFIKHMLKRVSRYENKFSCMEKVAKFTFGKQLQINELTISNMKGNIIKPNLQAWQRSPSTRTSLPRCRRSLSSWLLLTSSRSTS